MTRTPTDASDSKSQHTSAQGECGPGYKVADLAGFERQRRERKRRRNTRIRIVAAVFWAVIVVFWVFASRNPQVQLASVPGTPTNKPLSPTDKQLIEPVYRAAKAIEGSTGVGVNYVRYQELVQAFVTELSIASDKIQSLEGNRAIAAYAKAAMCYNDSLTLWAAKIDSSGKTWKGQIAFWSENDKVGQVAVRYGLPYTTNTMPYTRETWFGLSPDSVQVVWLHADRELVTAHEMFLRN